MYMITTNNCIIFYIYIIDKLIHTYIYIFKIIKMFVFFNNITNQSSYYVPSTSYIIIQYMYIHETYNNVYIVYRVYISYLL